MPVVNLSVARLEKMLPGASFKRLFDSLPYIGLDIEGQDGGVIRVEYNPNRPDFCSDYGIARGLRGLLGIETGLPRIALAGKSGLSILVDTSVKHLRPYIAAMVATGGSLDDPTIRQLIGMQEDLHAGLGRRRKKASVGLHDLDDIRFPITYTTVDRHYSFAPLGEDTKKTINQIISESPAGREYGHLVSTFDRFPVLFDSMTKTVSLPPIINGNDTRVDSATKNLFIEVTGSEERAVNDVLSIFAAALFDAGFEIKSVKITLGRKSSDTPRMHLRKIGVSASYLNSILGTELSIREIKSCIEKCRLGASITQKGIVCSIPPYRTDISDPIDIAEEVAIGYGIYRLSPSFPMSSTAGGQNILSRRIAAARDCIIGLGFTEAIGFSLTDANTHYSPFGIEVLDNKLKVDSTKSSEHEMLRSSLIPSLLLVLSRNIHEIYPQRLFEIGKVFSESDGRESWNFAAVTAHVDAAYTEAKSVVHAALRSAYGLQLTTRPKEFPYFVSGRAAQIIISGRAVGSIGEITPRAIDWFKLRTPVSAFELNLSEFLEDV